MDIVWMNFNACLQGRDVIACLESSGLTIEEMVKDFTLLSSSPSLILEPLWLGRTEILLYCSECMV
jgi:hypothetical protein